MNEQQSKEVFQTEDMALCAYLQMKGIKMINYEHNKNKIRFILQDENDICKIGGSQHNQIEE